MSFFKRFLGQDENSGDKALLEAIKKDNTKKVEELLSNEDINKEDENLLTPLEHALNNASINVASFLLEEGASLQESIENNSVISHLVRVGTTPEMIHLLHTKGASTSSEYGVSPVEMAIQTGCELDVFRAVCEVSEVRESEGKSPLAHQVVDAKNLNLKTKQAFLEVLVKEYGHDLNEDSRELHLASKLFNKREFELLATAIELGVSINSVANRLVQFMGEKKVKALGTYITKYPQANKEAFFLHVLGFKSAKQYYESVSSCEGRGFILALCKNVLLHDKERIELAKIALNKGADIHELSKDEHPSNAIKTFTANFDIGKNTLFLDFLLAQGAKVEYNGFSVLFDTVLDNDVKLTKYLLEKGADVNFINYFQNSLVNVLIFPKAKYKDENERLAMLKLLLSYGLDVKQKISHYKNESQRGTGILEACLDLGLSKLSAYLLEQCSGIEVSDECVIYAIKRDIEESLAKKLISLRPEVKALREYYCKIRDKYFDASLLALCVDNKKEVLAQYILENFPQVQAYTQDYPLPLFALRNGFSMHFVKTLVVLDSDINRLYYENEQDPSTYTMLAKFLSGYQDQSQEVRADLGRFIIENGADISKGSSRVEATKDFLDQHGMTLLAMNKESFESEVLSMLFECGENPNKATANLNETQIHSMVNRYRNMSDELVIEYLEFFKRKCGVDLEAKNNFGTNLLLGAAMLGRPKTLKWLIDEGANVHVVGGFDNSPALHKAISNYADNEAKARVETVKVLLEAGVDIEQFDSEQFTPLMSAANYGCFEVVQTLLKHGAKPDVFNEAGESAAHRAILGEASYEDEQNPMLARSKMLAVLKDAGANLDLGSSEQLPPLSLCIVEDKRELFNTLMQLKPDVNQLDMLKRSPLMLAIGYGEMFYVNKLMRHKQSRLDIIDANNESLHFAAVLRANTKEGKQLLQYFLDEKLTIGSGREGFSLLHTAAYYVNLEAFELLKGYYEDVNITDARGFTPLFWAIYSNLDIDDEKRKKMLDLLVQKGANLQHRLEDGANALALAVLAGSKELSAHLIALGVSVQTALSFVKGIEGVAPEAIEYLEAHRS